MKRVVYLSLCLLLLASCGSYKKAVKEQTSQTSTVNSSSTETVTVTHTTWYDTSRVDSNGVAPVLKEETVTSTTRHGKRTTKGSDERKDSDEKSQSQTNIENSATTEESAVSVSTSSKTKDVSASETKQVQYTSWALFGLGFVIISAILAYWVFTKYRQRKG